MKNLSKKSVSLVLIFTIFMAIFMPTIVRADTPLFQHIITVSPDIMTVYVGNVSVDGTSEIKYLYIENAVNSATVNNGLSKILTSDYSDMLARGTISSDGTVKVSNSHESDMSASWKNATNVANTYYGTTGTISDTSTTQINYNSTKYNEAVSNASALASAEINAISGYITAYNERKTEWETSNPGYDYSGMEEYTPPVITNYDLSSLTGEYIIIDNITRTGEDYYQYYMLNGQLKKYNLIDIDRTIVRVVNTSANVVQPTKINTLNISITNPKVGDTATTTTKPNVTIDNNAGYKLDFTQYLTKPETEGGIQFTGTFEKDKDYYVEVSLEANENYNFASSDNMTLKVNGKTTDYTINNSPDGSRYFLFYAKVQPTAEEEPAPTTTTYEYIDNTANQTYTINEDDALTFRINADFSLFENGGAVYVDGTETNDFTASSGSTIITFAKEYVSSLSEGEHTLKVAFNNGGEATTKFTVAKANITAEETTPTETATTEEAKTEESTLKNPKTGDNIALWVSLVIVSMLGIAGTIKYTKKRE